LWIKNGGVNSINRREGEGGNSRKGEEWVPYSYRAGTSVCKDLSGFGIQMPRNGGF